MDLLVLKQEITIDPAGVGYASAGGDHVKLARLINKPTRQVDSNEQRPTSSLLSILNPQEVITAVAMPAKAEMLQMICSMPTISFADKKLKAWMVTIFGPGSETLIAFNKLTKRSGTRAEELGLGHVTESNIADALLRT